MGIDVDEIVVSRKKKKYRRIYKKGVSREYKKL